MENENEKGILTPKSRNPENGRIGICRGIVRALPPETICPETPVPRLLPAPAPAGAPQKRPAGFWGRTHPDSWGRSRPGQDRHAPGG